MADLLCRKPDSVDAFDKPINAREVGGARDFAMTRCSETNVSDYRSKILNRTPAAARSSRAPPEPGRTFRCSLLARCAGVHVDFHAHRHFDDLRSLPSHSGSSQLIWRDVHAGAEPRAPSDAAQVRNIDTESAVQADISLLDKVTSLLGKALRDPVRFANSQLGNSFPADDAWQRCSAREEAACIDDEILLQLPQPVVSHWPDQQAFRPSSRQTWRLGPAAPPSADLASAFAYPAKTPQRRWLHDSSCWLARVP